MKNLVKNMEMAINEKIRKYGIANVMLFIENTSCNFYQMQEVNILKVTNNNTTLEFDTNVDEKSLTLGLDYINLKYDEKSCNAYKFEYENNFTVTMCIL